MGKNDVNVTMNGNSTDAVNAWKAIIQAVRETQRGIERLTTVASGAARRQAQGFKDTTKAAKGFHELLGRYASAFGIFEVGRRALALLRAEFEDLTKAQEEATKKQLTYQDALYQLRIQMPVTSDISFEELREEIRKASGPVSPDVVAGMALTAISAGQGISERERWDVVKEVIRARPDLRSQPAQMNAIVASVLEMRRAFPEQTSRQTLGQIMAAQTQARVVDPAKFGEISAGVANLGAFGYDPRAGFALHAAVGTISADPEGSITRTALMNFAMQLRAESRARGVTDIEGLDLIKFIRQDKGGVGEEIRNYLLRSAITGREEMEEALAVVPPGQERDKLLTRAKTFTALVGLLDETAEKTNKTWRVFEEAMKNIPEGAAAEADLKRRLDALRSDPKFAVFWQEMAAERGITQAQLDEEMAIRGTAARLSEIERSAQSRGWLGRQITGTADVAAAQAMTPEQFLRYQRQRLEGEGGAGGYVSRFGDWIETSFWNQLLGPRAGVVGPTGAYTWGLRGSPNLGRFIYDSFTQRRGGNPEALDEAAEVMRATEEAMKERQQDAQPVKIEQQTPSLPAQLMSGYNNVSQFFRVFGY